VFDRQTGALLAQTEFLFSETGAYLKLGARGALRIQIRSLSGPPALLSGLFIDDYAHTDPAIQLSAPANQTIVPVSSDLQLVANLVPGDRPIILVEFYVNSELIARASAPPYQATITNILEGHYQLSARAIDDLGFRQDSDPVFVQAELPPAEARFLGVDDLTQGTWAGRYGLQGAWLASLENTAKPPLSIDAGLSPVFVWGWSDIAPNALTTSLPGGRIASCWVAADKLEFQFAAQDGQARQLALYFLDWDSGARFQRVEMLDAKTGVVLDNRDVRSFSHGRYLIYQIKGRVKLRVTRLQSNTVLSAFFFDPPTPPYRQWQMRSFPGQWLDDSVAGEQANEDADPFNNFLEFAFGLDPHRADTSPYLAVTRRGQDLEVTFRRIAAGGAQIGFETSNDLTHWQPAGTEVQTVEVRTDGQYQFVTVRLSSSTSVEFLRLTVQRQQEH
jgi:hypothetical protein